MKSLLVRAASLVIFLTSSSAIAQDADPYLGTAQDFAVLAGSTVTNTGPTVVTGDVGVSPGTEVTGFGPGIVVGGTIHSNDSVAQEAQTDLTDAYTTLSTLPCGADLTGVDLGVFNAANPLPPGAYCFSSSAQLTGSLVLDAEGDPDAQFIFQIGTTLTTASGATVEVINGGSGCNVYFQVGSSATLGTGSSVVGNILAQESITLTTGANLDGRALARDGAVTLDSNRVGGCGAGSAGQTVPGIPTLDTMGLSIFVLLLTTAGLFLVNRPAA